MRRTGTTALLLLLWTGGQSLHAQTRVDVLFHGAALDYAGSELKRDGSVVGVYGYLGSGLSHVLEGTASQTRIDYRDGTRLSQVDVSGAYTHYFPKTTLRFGGHLIDSTDRLTDGGTVVFANVGRYVPYVWNANVGFAQTSYPNYDESDAAIGGRRIRTDGLSVLQISPGAGLSWGDITGYRFFYASLRGHYIRLSKDVGLGDRTFLSMQASLDYFYKKATVSGFVWSGAQAFAVRQGGFTAYNLPERHTGGYGGSLRYVLAPKAAATVGVYSERFRDLGFDADVSATIVTLSLGFTL